MLGSCKVCNDAHANFTSHNTVIHPLPLMRLLYRSHIDLMESFPTIVCGHRYVMVMIESGAKVSMGCCARLAAAQK